MLTYADVCKRLQTYAFSILSGYFRARIEASKWSSLDGAGLGVDVGDSEHIYMRRSCAEHKYTALAGPHTRAAAPATKHI